MDKRIGCLIPGGKEISTGKLYKAKGYDIMDRTGEVGAAIGETRDRISGVTTNARTILVACKK